MEAQRLEELEHLRERGRLARRLPLRELVRELTLSSSSLKKTTMTTFVRASTLLTAVKFANRTVVVTERSP
jgi:hypothetical protein